jgi:hypothetical protein
LKKVLAMRRRSNGVSLAQQIADHANFVADFRSTQNGHKRALGLGNGLSKVLISFSSRNRYTRQVVGDAHRGRMCAVSRTKSIVHLQISQGCQLTRHFGSFLFRRHRSGYFPEPECRRL